MLNGCITARQQSRTEGTAAAMIPPADAGNSSASGKSATRTASYKFKKRMLKRKRKLDSLSRIIIDWSHHCCWRELAQSLPNLKYLFDTAPSHKGLAKATSSQIIEHEKSKCLSKLMVMRSCIHH